MRRANWQRVEVTSHDAAEAIRQVLLAETVMTPYLLRHAPDLCVSSTGSEARIGHAPDFTRRLAGQVAARAGMIAEQGGVAGQLRPLLHRRGCH
jgi:hypothetical protein